MVSVLGVIISLVLGLVKLTTLFWVFYQTRKTAAIAYSTYLIINGFLYTWCIPRVVNSIQNNGDMLWLGATSGERISNFLFLIRFVPTGVEALLFVWLLLSIMRRTS